MMRLILVAAAAFATAALPTLVAAGSQNTSRVDVDDANIFFFGGRRPDWLNYHKSINVGGNFEEIFHPTNDYNFAESSNSRYQTKEFMSGLNALRDIVDQAEVAGKRVRAYGSRWSLSNVAYTSEYVVESWGLNYLDVGIHDETYVTNEYLDKKDKLAFVQCGVMVQDLHQALFEKGLALSTTGASDGQRIAGAISTGTHGSANQVGAMQDYAKALHLVIPGGHVLLQRASDAVVTQEYAEYLGNATLINDDALFNAAIVSFGSFGLIHGIILETEPLYMLRMQAKELPFNDEVKEAMRTMNVDKLGFHGVKGLPFHFEVTLNPYNRNSRRRGAFVRIMQKIPIQPNELAMYQRNGGERPAFRANPEKEDIFDAVGNFFTARRWTFGAIARRLVYRLGMNVVLMAFFDIRASRNNGPMAKYPFEYFTSDMANKPFTKAPLPGTGMEIGVPQKHVLEAVDMVLNIMWADPMAGQVAIRFVPPSNATLAFTKFEDYTATIEMSAPYTRLMFRETARVQKKIFDAFEARADEIPYTYHWGQLFPVNSRWVDKSFGDKVDEWKIQRSALLDAVGREMFANDLIESLGLHEP